MGVTGVEGVFRRCCEEALSVMRTNKEALLTIVELFIHDLLYKWALSPLKALQRQKETDDDLETNLEDSKEEYEGNKDVARALMLVKQNLDGYEEGEMRSMHGFNNLYKMLLILIVCVKCFLDASLVVTNLSSQC